MEFLPVFMMVLLVLESSVHICSGIVIWRRRNHKVFRVRSAALLQISHWANFIESVIVLYELEEYSYNGVGYEWILIVASFVKFLIHYLFFIPFILRTYRLYLIFTVKESRISLSQTIIKLIRRTSQKWLLKMLLLISFPFPVIYIVTFVVYPKNFNMIGGETNVSNGNEIAIHSISLLLTFIEQLISIISIYSIRNINDDYKMSTELTLINLTWVITSPNNIFGNYSLFSYQILLRNNLVFTINALYPLYKSQKKVDFDIPITEEILNELLPLLNHELSLRYFERFLRNNTDLKYSNYPGVEFLKIWIYCELLEFNPEAGVELPEAKNALESNDGSISSIKFETFQVLDKNFFSLFQGSEEYLQCLKEINVMNICERRIQGEDVRALTSIIKKK